jgi:hypothetical protein
MALRACPEFIDGTNGGVFDLLEDFPFMLRHSKHSECLFSDLLGISVTSALKNPY